MANNFIIGTLGGLIVIGLIVLIIIESTTPVKVRTVTKTDVVPVPVYPEWRRRRDRRHWDPDYRQPGHRNTPFCQHTENGCYPGTQTPIP